MNEKLIGYEIRTLGNGSFQLVSLWRRGVWPFRRTREQHHSTCRDRRSAEDYMKWLVAEHNGHEVARAESYDRFGELRPLALPIL